MKISKMIKNLQEFMDKNGDLDCWYAVDDEGNGYQEVNYEPSLYYVDSSLEGEVYASLEDAEECGVDMRFIKSICIVN